MRGARGLEEEILRGRGSWEGISEGRRGPRGRDRGRRTGSWEGISEGRKGPRGRDS